MDPRFSPHNAHLESTEAFGTRDPHLSSLAREPLRWESPLLDHLPREPGIYTLGGGRQVGKTTLAKQWMQRLLRDGVEPSALRFLTGELIDDHHALVAMVQDLLPEAGQGRRFLILDEVTYVRDWDQGIKFLADAGLLEDLILLLTGSDLALIREARARLPGRRGGADVADFHLHPLSFGAAVRLRRADEVEAWLADDAPLPPATLHELEAELESYLHHGGYLTAINDVAREGRVLPATLRIYSDWLRGDVTKRGRSESSLREVASTIVRRLGSQVTWNSLARELSIDHPKTVQDYVGLLVSMDAVFVQPALLEQRLSAAPKKARKVMFTDPFIHHALCQWLEPRKEPWTEWIRPAVADPDTASKLVESVVATHYRRFLPTYYIKGRRGEVDVAVVRSGGFEPIEVKWRSRFRAGENRQLSAYPNARILARVRREARSEGIPVKPLVEELLRLDRGGLEQPLGVES